MTIRPPAVLCPIDFSDASKSALLYAAAVADHFGARLTALTIDDPLLNEVAQTTGIASLAAESERELQRFCREVLPAFASGPKTIEFRVAVGKPATAILREAREIGADLIVISSHGRSGIRKMFFGSTTERVLRETSVPVLITPGDRPSTSSLSEIARHVHRVIAPVDLTEASARQLTIANGIAQGLSLPLIVAHVIEPVFVPYNVRLAMPGADSSRRAQVEERLGEFTKSLGPVAAPETIVLTGDPSEEIVKLAAAREANLIVMGLHSSGFLGPRMGSVTYRVLCLARGLVLAIPPRPEPLARGSQQTTHTAVAV